MYSLGTMREYSAFGGDHSRSFRSYSTDHNEEQVNNMREREHNLYDAIISGKQYCYYV